MLLRILAGWICFVFVSITLPIYISLIALLLVYRNANELKGAFFKLCISLGICDIVSMINNYLGYRFPSLGWDADFYLNGGPALGKFFILSAWGLRMTQGMGVTLLAVNRTTAVIWPHKYLKLWSIRTLSAAIGLQILNGILFALPLSFHEYHWEIDNQSSMLIKFNDVDFENNYFMVAFLMQTVLVTVITICYVSMFISFRRRNKKVTSSKKVARANSRNKQSQELKLATMGSIVCFFEVLWFVFAMFESMMSTDTFFLIYNSLSDVYSGINPYLMFAFSSAIRDRVKMVLGCHVKTSPLIPPTTRAVVSTMPTMTPRTQVSRRMPSIAR